MPFPTRDRDESPTRRPSAGTARVLIVDDNKTTLDTFALVLRKSGFQVTPATDCRTALTAARQGFDVMLLDVRLGFEDGLEVLRALRAEGRRGEVVVITGFDTEVIEREARSLGAEFVDRWTLPDPVALVERALGRAADSQPTPGPAITPPTLTRWAEAVARALKAEEDPTSVARWGHAIGMSEGALRDLCQLAGISAKQSCSLARVLRAIHLARVSGRMDLVEWLDARDVRTFKRLLRDTGVGDAVSVPLSEVLWRQRLVQDDTAIALLSRSLRRHGFAGSECR